MSHEVFLRAWHEDETDQSFLAEILATAAEFAALMYTLATLPFRFALPLAGP